MANRIYSAKQGQIKKTKREDKIKFITPLVNTVVNAHNNQAKKCERQKRKVIIK